MPLTDLETAFPAQVKTLRETQYAAQPTQALDSTTIFVNEVARIRNLDVVVTPLDSNLELAQAWLVST